MNQRFNYAQFMISSIPPPTTTASYLVEHEILSSYLNSKQIFHINQIVFMCKYLLKFCTMNKNKTPLLMALNRCKTMDKRHLFVLLCQFQSFYNSMKTYFKLFYD